MTRREAIEQFGCAVLYRADSLVGPDPYEIPDGDPLLEDLTDAFPHGSLSEMLGAMLEGLNVPPRPGGPS
jgi:hypothetical protein